MIKKYLFIFLIFLPVMLNAEEADYFDLSFKELMEIEIVGSTLTSKNLKTVLTSKFQVDVPQ